MLNIGTSNNLSKEKDIDKLLHGFDINALASSSPKFSLEVLRTLNKEIIQLYDFSDVKQKFIDLDINNASEIFWMFAKNNIIFFKDALDWLNIVYSKESYISKTNDYLKIAAELLPGEPYDVNTWEKWTNLIKHKTGKKGKNLFMPLRLALTGKEKGPELKYLLPLLNKKHILNKLG